MQCHSAHIEGNATMSSAHVKEHCSRVEDPDLYSTEDTSIISDICFLRWLRGFIPCDVDDSSSHRIQSRWPSCEDRVSTALHARATWWSTWELCCVPQIEMNTNKKDMAGHMSDSVDDIWYMSDTDMPTKRTCQCFKGGTRNFMWNSHEF